MSDNRKPPDHTLDHSGFVLDYLRATAAEVAKRNNRILDAQIARGERPRRTFVVRMRLDIEERGRTEVVTHGVSVFRWPEVEGEERNLSPEDIALLATARIGDDMRSRIRERLEHDLEPEHPEAPEEWHLPR